MYLRENNDNLSETKKNVFFQHVSQPFLKMRFFLLDMMLGGGKGKGGEVLLALLGKFLILSHLGLQNMLLDSTIFG